MQRASHAHEGVTVLGVIAPRVDAHKSDSNTRYHPFFGSYQETPANDRVYHFFKKGIAWDHPRRVASKCLGGWPEVAT